MFKNLSIFVIIFSMSTLLTNAYLSDTSKNKLDTATNKLFTNIENKYSIDTQKNILVKLNKKIFYQKILDKNNPDKIETLTYVQNSIKNELYKLSWGNNKKNKNVVTNTPIIPVVIEKPVIPVLPITPIKKVTPVVPVTPIKKVTPVVPVVGKPIVGTTTCADYYIHKGINASTFWVWEWADASNGYISNVQSAWDEAWYKNFNNWTENYFYVALPYNDFANWKRKNDIVNIPWYKSNIKSNESVVKNKWIKVEYNWKVAYGQWEDVWPFLENDFNYVFWTSAPKNNTLLNAWIDLSPDLAKFIWFDWSWKVNWNFVQDNCVPSWDWTKIITKNNVSWLR